MFKNKWLKFLYLLPLFACIGFSIGVSAEQLVVVGEAYRLDDGKPVYREYHYYSEDRLNHQVVYYALDNDPGAGKRLELMAEKTLNYRYGLASPEFTQRNYIYPEVIEVEWQGQALSISYQQGDKGATKAQEQPLKTPLVIDAGFDHFIRQQWQPLVAGETLDFYYAAPTRQSLLALQVQKKSCGPDQVDRACFEINSSNWLVRLVLQPIEISYDLENKKLRRFRGLANMLDRDGGSLKVDIRYCYLSEPTTSEACNAEALKHAANQLASRVNNID